MQGIRVDIFGGWTLLNTNKISLDVHRHFFTKKYLIIEAEMVQFINNCDITVKDSKVNNIETKDARKQLKHDSISYSFMKKYFYITAAAVIYFN